MGWIKLQRLALFNMIYLLLVILFGAFVRATGSGAGCGAHWPLCNGQVIPRTPSITTVIEFSHRISSGLTLLLIILLLVLCFKQSQPSHPIRTAAVLTLIFIITEALVGAFLVLFEHVADNVSSYRALSMGLHLINTFTLMAMCTSVFYFARYPYAYQKNTSSMHFSYWIGICILIITGITGAITALGDTIFPLPEGVSAFNQSLAPDGHIFVKLRIYHPLLAIFSSMYLLLNVKYFVKHAKSNLRLNRVGNSISLLIASQVLLGFLNIWLRAPVTIQLCHLLLAQLIWIFYIFLGLRLFYTQVAIEPATH